MEILNIKSNVLDRIKFSSELNLVCNFSSYLVNKIIGSSGIVTVLVINSEVKLEEL